MVQRKQKMLTDNQLVVVSLSLLGIALVGTLIGLLVYFLYLKPNFFYGDYVVLSVQDASGQDWWVYNNGTKMTFTKYQEQASVLRFMPGLSGAKGQLFEGSETTFELRNPKYGAYLTATCYADNSQPPTTGFSTTTGTQLGAESSGVAIDTIQKGPAIQSGKQYALRMIKFDCESDNCSIDDLCDIGGCQFNIEASNTDDDTVPFRTIIDCDSDTPFLWTFTKVENVKLYSDFNVTLEHDFETEKTKSVGAMALQ